MNGSGARAILACLTVRSVSDETALRDPRERQRVVEILDAACRVVARDGWHGLRVGAVAREAGVSKALVHYYFSTRDAVLRAAFLHSEQRANALLERELAAIEEPRERLERFLVAYLDDEPAYRENRVGWIEIWAAMRNDPELRDDVEPPYRGWLEQLGALIGQAGRDEERTDGDAWETALRLAALLDGLESLLLLDLVTPENARAMLRDAIERELSAPISRGAAA